MRGTSKAPPSGSKSKLRKRLRTRFGVPAALIAVLVLALPAGASALGLGETEEFFEPTQPTKPLTLTEGPDGNMWYTDSSVTKIGKVTPEGNVSEFSPGLTGVALSITSGPESKLWFTEKAAKKIGSIETSGAGLAECTVEGEPESIAAAGGNLWFTFIPTVAPTTRRIGKLVPGGGCGITEFIPGTTPGYASTSVAATIIAGGDGNLYYGTIGSTKSIGKITLPGETFTEFTVNGSGSGQPYSLTYGGDGRIWFAATNTTKPTEERIGAITTDGVTTNYYNTGLGGLGAGGANLTGFATGADGNVWVREPNERNERQRITLKTSGPEDLGGTYKLKFKGEETAPLAFNAEPITVEEALGALPSIGGVANVKGITGFTGGALVERTVEFEGKFARTDVPMLECISSLTGTGATCSIEPGNSGAVAQKLYRFKPNGTYKIFPFAPRHKGVTPTTIGKNGTLAPGPGSSLWFSTAGDSKFGPEPGVTPAIGKFGTETAELTAKIEAGEGTVQSSPAGIEACGTATGTECSAEFTKDSPVTLTASPAAGYQFSAWKYCDSTLVIPGVTGVKGRQCTVKMSAAKKVWAKFIPAVNLAVTKTSPIAGGTVSTSPAGVNCGVTCVSSTAFYKESILLTLKQKPAKHFHFVEFKEGTGSAEFCNGKAADCVIPSFTADSTLKAEFAEDAKATLSYSVDAEGGGQGSVTTKPAGIACGYTCTAAAAEFYEEENGGPAPAIEVKVKLNKGTTSVKWTTGAGTGNCQNGKTVSLAEFTCTVPANTETLVAKYE